MTLILSLSAARSFAGVVFLSVVVSSSSGGAWPSVFFVAVVCLEDSASTSDFLSSFDSVGASASSFISKIRKCKESCSLSI